MDIVTNIDLKIIKQLKSEGANSKLYLVEDSQMEREFILKKISKSSFKNPEKYFEESKKISKAEHPNIININHVSYDEENSKSVSLFAIASGYLLGCCGNDIDRCVYVADGSASYIAHAV